MKHSINFYLDELKPQVYYLTLRNTVIAAVVCAVAITVWKFILDGEIKQNKQKVNAIQAQLSNSQGSLEALQAELIKHNDKATFNQRKQRLEKNLNAKQLLWQGVGKDLEAVTINYHSALDQLTKFHDDNIWLSSFQISEGQMAFSGYALDSSSVTRWMTKLQSTSAFKGREFSKMSIKAHDENSLTFVVATSSQASEGLPVQPVVGNNQANIPATPAKVQLPEVSVNE